MINTLQKQADEEIINTCKYGSLADLIKLRAEVISEITNNKFYLKKIDEAMKKAIRGDFYVSQT